MVSAIFCSKRLYLEKSRTIFSPVKLSKKPLSPLDSSSIYNSHIKRNKKKSGKDAPNFN